MPGKTARPGAPGIHRATVMGASTSARARKALYLAVALALNGGALAAPPTFVTEPTRASNGDTSLTTYIHPDDGDAGRNGELYFAGYYQGVFYFLRDGAWTPWDGHAAFPAYKSTTLGDDRILLSANLDGLEGVRFFAAYGIGGALKRYDEVYTVPDFSVAIEESGAPARVTLVLTPKASLQGQSGGVEVFAQVGEARVALTPQNTWAAASEGGVLYFQGTFGAPLSILLLDGQDLSAIAGTRILARVTRQDGAPQTVAVHAIPFAPVMLAAIDGQAATTTPTLPAGARIVAIDTASSLGGGVTLDAASGAVTYAKTGVAADQTADTFQAKVRTASGGIAALPFKVALAQDIDPTLTYTLSDRSGVSRNVALEFGSVKITSLSAGVALPVRGDAGLEFSTDGGATWFATGTTKKDDTLKVRIRNTGSDYGRTTTLAFSIGDKTKTVRFTTEAEPDPGPPPNSAPTLSTVAAQSIAKNANTGALAVTVGDAETAAGSLTVSASSSNTTLLPNGNLVWGGAGANRTLTATPAAGQTGSATVTYTVGDGAATTSKTFTLNVAGTAPTLAAIAAQTPTSGTAYSLALAGYVTQTEGDAITGYRIASGSLPTGLSLNTASGAITGTPSATGNFTVTIQAQDADGWSNAGQIDFTVAAAADTTLPATPTIAIADGNAADGTGSAGYTNSTAVNLTIGNDTDNVGVAGWYVAESSSSPAAGAGGWVGARPTTATLSAGDGVKTLYVWTKDTAGNVSNAGSGTIELGTVAPATATIVSMVPDSKETNYGNVTLSGDKSFTGASVAATSRNGGTILGVSINGSGQIVIASYDTPNVNPDYLDITGTDKYGNAISIARRIDLPN